MARDNDSEDEGPDWSGAGPEQRASADDPPSPTAAGVALLRYVPTTVVGILLVIAGTREFLQYLGASLQTFDGFATPVVLLTLGTGLVVASLGAASVRARRAAYPRGHRGDR